MNLNLLFSSLWFRTATAFLLLSHIPFLHFNKRHVTAILWLCFFVFFFGQRFLAFLLDCFNCQVTGNWELRRYIYIYIYIYMYYSPFRMTFCTLHIMVLFALRGLWSGGSLCQISSIVLFVETWLHYPFTSLKHLQLRFIFTCKRILCIFAPPSIKTVF